MHCCYACYAYHISDMHTIANHISAMQRNVVCVTQIRKMLAWEWFLEQKWHDRRMDNTNEWNTSHISIMRSYPPIMQSANAKYPPRVRLALPETTHVWSCHPPVPRMRETNGTSSKFPRFAQYSTNTTPSQTSIVTKTPGRKSSSVFSKPSE